MAAFLGIILLFLLAGICIDIVKLAIHTDLVGFLLILAGAMKLIEESNASNRRRGGGGSHH